MTPIEALEVLELEAAELWQHVERGGRLARTAALALARRGSDDDRARLLVHPEAAVRAAALWAAGPARIGETAATRLLEDPDPLVVEAACWVLGELEAASAVSALARLARRHDDLRVRESSVAALGAIGDLRGLDAVLEAASGDKPAVRRRAVVALCGFVDPRAEEALRRACDDRDRGVRSLARDLVRDRGALDES